MFKSDPNGIKFSLDIYNKYIEEEEKEFDRTLDVVVDKLEIEGWTIPPQVTIFAIKKIGEKNNDVEILKDLNNYFKLYFSRDNYIMLKEMIDSILSSNIRDGLKKVITECWKAFQSGLYSICATSLITVIEGILSEVGEDKRDIRMMKLCQKKIDELPENISTLEKHIWISYSRFIKNLYMKSDFNSDEPERVNRHWLLHGRSDFEINELDCIRLFNSVDSLCMIIK